MTEWKTYRLGDIIDKVIDNRGKSAPTSDEEYSPIIEINSIGDRNPNYDVVRKWVSKDTYDTWFRSGHPMIGDILIPTVGTIGIVSMMRENKGCIAQNIVALRTNEKAHNLYLYYFLKSGYVKHELLNLNIGGVQPSIKVPHLLNLEISLPSLEEQRKIAGILGAIDDKIENNRRINDNLEKQAQALFDKIFFDDNDAERNPLSDYADINPTRTLHQGVAARYIEMANLPTRGSFPSDWSYKSYGGGCKFANGDTIMARITPCLENGKTAYIDFLEEQEVAFGSTEYIVISSKSGYCPALFYFLARNKEFVDYAVGHMNGSSGRQRVSGADIANFPMPHITLEESNKFAEIAMPIMDVIRNNSLENRHLATLRDTLLPKLMNGEIKL